MTEGKRCVPLKITQPAGGRPVVMLDGMDITNLIASEGLSIVWDGHAPNRPNVEIVLASDAVDLDLDVGLTFDVLEFVRANDKAGPA